MKSSYLLRVSLAFCLAAASSPSLAGAAPDQGDRLNGQFAVCGRTSSSPGAAGAMWWLRYMCWALNE